MKKHLIATVNRVKLGHAVSSGFICEKIHFSKVMDQIINCSTLSTKTIKSMLYSDLKETDWSYFFLPLLMAKGQWRDSKVSRLAENTSKESCYKQLKRIFRSCSRGLPNYCSITHHTIWNIWSLWWARNILVFKYTSNNQRHKGSSLF